MAPGDPYRILAELARHGVQYVVIGGIAAAIHGSPSNTFDLDVCYSREPQNLVRLTATLLELHAQLRVARESKPVPFRLDPRTLRAGDSFTFDTDAGPFDILGHPAGSAGYQDLAQTAVEIDLGGVIALVASLDSLIAMKRAAGRPKDRVELEILYALQEQIEGAAKSDLRKLLTRFVAGEDISLEFARTIEIFLADHFRGVDDFESLREALARYQPGGGEYLYDEASLRAKFREALATLLRPPEDG